MHFQASAQQASKPFSHELHLKLKPDCVSCHSAAPASTSLSDNLLPSEQACKPCHQQVAIKQPASLLLKRFNHQKHLSLGNIAPVLKAAIQSGSYLSPPGDIADHLDTKNACGACHRGMEQSTAVTDAAFPEMADCLVCHSKVDPPFSCEFCHDPGPHLKPATHTPDYLDRHNRKGAIENKASCAVCHGRKFTCLGCH